MSVRLPLFPLRAVLLPTVGMGIHVFEERYRQLTRRCLSENASFGVALIKIGHEVGAPAVPHDVGTEARILQVREYGDGRYDLVVLGARRFRITHLFRGKPYLEAEVEWIPEPAEDKLVLNRLKRAVEARLRTCWQMFGDPTSARALRPSDDVDASSLSYLLTSMLPINAKKQQKLLEANTTEDRLEMEIDILSALALNLPPRREAEK